MHHPPAPVLHHRQVGTRAVEQAGAVEQADGHDRRGEQRQQVLVARLAQGGNHAAQHQHQPEGHAEELADLPQAAKVDVLVALVAEPEVQLRRHHLGDRQVVAGVRADHHHDQRPEQDVDAELLVFRVLAAVDQRRQEQAGGEEAGGDPEQRALQVPGAHEGVGEPLRQVEAVELLAFHRVVRGEAAEHDLEAEQRHHQEQVLAQRLLRRRQGDQGQRVAGRRRRFLLVMPAQEGPGPDQQADAGDQQDHAGDRPEHVLRGRVVVDQRLVRPVVAVGRVAARTLGGGDPGGPEEELAELRPVFRVRQGVFLHGEAFAARLQLRIGAEQLVVVGGGLLHRLDAARREMQPALVVDLVAAVLLLQLEAQLRLGRFIQLGIVRAEFLARGDVEPGGQFAVQPVGAPVRRLVGAVAPDRAELHAADALPGLLAVEDVALGEQHLAAGVEHLLRDRRRLAVDLAAEPAEQGEGDAEDQDQGPPVFAVFTHDSTPAAAWPGRRGCCFPDGCAASGRCAARPVRGRAPARYCRRRAAG
ncbi:hypothetical protein D9M69_329150 [compost metagenome]